MKEKNGRIDIPLLQVNILSNRKNRHLTKLGTRGPDVTKTLTCSNLVSPALFEFIEGSTSIF